MVSVLRPSTRMRPGRVDRPWWGKPRDGVAVVRRDSFWGEWLGVHAPRNRVGDTVTLQDSSMVWASSSGSADVTRTPRPSANLAESPPSAVTTTGTRRPSARTALAGQVECGRGSYLFFFELHCFLDMVGVHGQADGVVEHDEAEQDHDE